MKKILVILLFASSLFAQVEIGTSTALSSEPENTATLTLKTASGTRTMTWLQNKTWSGSGSTLMGSNNTWTGTNYIQQLQLGTDAISGYINRIRITPSGRLASTDDAGNEILYATTTELADAGLGTATDYARTTMTNDFTLVQNLNGGAVLGGRWTPHNVYSSHTWAGYGILQFPDGLLVNKWSDANNDKGIDTLATRSYVDGKNIEGISTTVDQYDIPADKSLTGTWDHTGGEVLVKANLPSMNYEIGASLDQANEGLHYYYNGGTIWSPSEDIIDAKDDAIYSYDTPSSGSTSITLDLEEDRNFVAHIFTSIASGGITITIDDASLGVVTFRIYDGANDDIDIVTSSTDEINWLYGDEPNLGYTDGRIYEITIINDGTLITGAYSWYGN